jgi:hypothetical protein
MAGARGRQFVGRLAPVAHWGMILREALSSKGCAADLPEIRFDGLIGHPRQVAY